MCNRDDLTLNALFDQSKDLSTEAKMFGSASNGTCKSILNVLKAFNLSNM